MKTQSIIILLLFPVFVFCQNLPKPAASFYFTGGSLEDETGHLNARAPGVSVTEDRFGNKNSAIFLAGNYNSYLNLGTGKILKPDKGTISLWVKIEHVLLKGSGVTINPIILTKNCACDFFYEGYFIGYDFMNQKLNAAAALNRETQLSVWTLERFTLREWHHVALTYDDNNFCLYIDGVSKVQQSKNFRSRFFEADSVMVGHTANERNKRFLNGVVDDILIFDRPLNSREIAELYNAPDPNKTRVFIIWTVKALLALGLFGFLLWLIIKRYKMKLEKEKERTKLFVKMHELESRAFKNQMNPHFIFNSLTSIQKMILENETETANEYLTRFSKLLRKLLESSVNETITLNEEIEILKEYMFIENLRFNNAFSYEVINSVENGDGVYIPLMLVQPFVENAIWHGLLPKEGEKKIIVRFSAHGQKSLLCEIEDNGVGMEKSRLKKNPLKTRSLAIDFIRQRLNVLSQTEGVPCSLEISDLKSDGDHRGTLVKIVIPGYVRAEELKNGTNDQRPEI